MNRYDKGFDLKVPAKLFVAPVEVLGKVLEHKQQLYDKYETAVDEIPLIADKIKALGGHKQIVAGVVNSYYDELLEAVEKHQGDFSMLGPKIQSVKRRLTRDVSPNGTLGTIHNYASEYTDWYNTYKNDKDVDTVLLGKMANLGYMNTYTDLDNFSINKQFSPNSSIFRESIPKNQEYILGKALDLGAKIEENTYDDVIEVIDKETGTIKTTNRKVTGRDPKEVESLLKAYLQGSADVQQGYKLAKMLGTTYDANPILKSAYDALTAVKEDNSISRSNLSEYALGKAGLSADTYTAPAINLGTRKAQDLSFDDNPLNSWWNKDISVWTGVYNEHGKKVGDNRSNSNIVSNMANTFVDWFKGNQNAEDKQQEAPVYKELRNKLLNAQTPQDVLAMSKRLFDEYKDKTYSMPIDGRPIVEGKDLRLAEAVFYNSLNRNQLVNSDGDVISIAPSEVKEILKTGKSPIYRLDNINGGGLRGFGMQLPGKGLVIALDTDATSIDQGNSIHDMWRLGGQKRFKEGTATIQNGNILLQ